VVERRERWKKVCARGASLAPVPGRSASPLEDAEEFLFMRRAPIREIGTKTLRSMLLLARARAVEVALVLLALVSAFGRGCVFARSCEFRIGCQLRSALWIPRAHSGFVYRSRLLRFAQHGGPGAQYAGGCVL
jgi:hypothetical protein